MADVTTPGVRWAQVSTTTTYTLTPNEARAALDLPPRPSYEVVNFGFGIVLWRDKATGYVRHPDLEVSIVGDASRFRRSLASAAGW